MVRGYTSIHSTSVLTTSQLDDLGEGGSFTVVSSGVTDNGGLNFLVDTISGPTVGTFVTDGVIPGDTAYNLVTSGSVTVAFVANEIALKMNDDGPVSEFYVAGRGYEIRRYNAGETGPLLLSEVVKEGVGYRFIFTDKDLLGNLV